MLPSQDVLKVGQSRPHMDQSSCMLCVSVPLGVLALSSSSGSEVCFVLVTMIYISQLTERSSSGLVVALPPLECLTHGATYTAKYAPSVL